MSLPNDWRQAEPDELDPASPLLAEAAEDERGEDYHPAAARPDLDDRANEADVVEQSYEVADDGDEPADT